MNLLMRFHTQVPLYVATKMTSKVALIRRSSLFIPAPEDYAKAAIGRIGYEARCAPYWAHSFQWCFAELLPDRVLDAWRLSVGIHRRGKLTAWISSGFLHISQWNSYWSRVFLRFLCRFQNLVLFNKAFFRKLFLKFIICKPLSPIVDIMIVIWQQWEGDCCDSNGVMAKNLISALQFSDSS